MKAPMKAFRVLCPLLFCSPADLHWKLDGAEDPARRRLRLRRNFHFER